MQVAVPLPSTTSLVDQVCHLPKDYFLPCELQRFYPATPTVVVTKADDSPVTKAIKETPLANFMDYKTAAETGRQRLAVELKAKEFCSPIEASPPLVAPSTEGIVVTEVLAAGQLENCDEIIPNLYLGGIETAENPDRMIEHGICAVVCCNRELEFPSSKFSNRLDYYRVDVEDMGREPIELFFPEATEFIHTQLSQERPVLVHCRAGVSRSSTVLLAYLIEYCDFSLHDAFFKLLRLRPTITPNLGFMDKLKAYEEEQRRVPGSIDVNKYGAWFQTRERNLEPDLATE